MDIAGVTMPVTKHNYIVKDVTKLADTIRKAFKIAKSGRPGPVLVDVTKDVTANVTEFYPKEPEEISPSVEYIARKRSGKGGFHDPGGKRNLISLR